VKDNDYNARFIFLAPPDVGELEQRLTKRGTDTPEKIKERLEIAAAEIKQSEIEGFHDKIIVNDDLNATYGTLEAYIFGVEEADSGESVVQDADGPAETTTAGDAAGTSAMELDDAAKA
jgi:THO complex subunit 1